MFCFFPLCLRRINVLFRNGDEAFREGLELLARSGFWLWCVAHKLFEIGWNNGQLAIMQGAALADPIRFWVVWIFWIERRLNWRRFKQAAAAKQNVMTLTSKRSALSFKDVSTPNSQISLRDVEVNHP
jgi:hypothetical protein